MRMLTSGFLAALVITATLPALPAAAATPITFGFGLAQPCIDGVAASEATVHVLWRGSDGSRKLRTTVEAALNGSFRACSSGNLVEVGDTVRADDGYSTHEFVVPNLTIFVNRDKHLIKGNAPAGGYVRLFCRCFAMGPWKIHVNSEGKWSFTSSWRFAGGISFLVAWKNVDGDSLSATGTSAYLTVRIGSAMVSGATRDGAPATVVLKRGAAFEVKATASAVGNIADGSFAGQLRNPQGDKVKVRVGDWITSDISSEVDWIVPDISAVADVSDHQVTGQCPDDGLVIITQSRDGSLWTDTSNSGYTDGGRFWFDTSDSFYDFQAGDRVLVSCELWRGDWVEKFFTAV